MAQPRERFRLKVAERFGVSPRRFEGWEPTETHKHYDADDTYTGKTIVTREPEYDDNTRSRLMALVAWDARCCTTCGNYDSLDPQGATGHTVTAPDGRVFEVEIYRCITCGVEQWARRQWGEEHKNDKPNATGNLAADGLNWVAQPRTEEGR